MKKNLLTFLSFLLASTLTVKGQSSEPEIAVIPKPAEIKTQAGYFVLPDHLQVSITNYPGSDFLLTSLSKKLSVAGIHVTHSSQGSISFLLNKNYDPTIGDEGYSLSVSAKAIQVKANKPAGMYYAMQTIFQLLPKEIESKAPVKNIHWKMPCVNIVDYPRFAWRGLMFDVARHFFTKKEVEDFIDNMAMYKYNLLHLHLTDDEGWRIQIKSLPRLTEVGAWNVKKVGTFGNFTPPTPDEPRNYGGFYTQDDIKELVQYAKDRFVNILPEIDVPGHSLAAIASYPELSCTPGAENYKVRSGESIMNWSAHGFTAKIDNTLCPANDKVYTFLDKVFTEVAALFPFDYIHVGGDECAKNFWEQSDAIKQLMTREGLKNYEEVQSYFEKKVEKIILSKGKKFIGWDEILEGGLAPSAIVMSWRGMKGGIEAAKMGHQVVMSPTTFAYLDYMQGDKVIEPPVYATLRLNKAYEFEPVPDSVDAKLIIGGQANLWSEQVYNTRHLQYMVWPRAFAIAEAVWSPRNARNWKDFEKRVEKHFARFDEAEIKYAPSIFDPSFSVSTTATNELKVEMATEVDDLDIYYSFDNSFPDRFYPKYTGPLIVPKDAVNLKVITYRGTQKIGRDITMPIEELKSRLPKAKK
ncbi:MAG: family 20 glycosylhydrolase [Bacteroidota bacterium]|nr:family 20 glycosylhydrolase [Bacteroidota bacterium]